MGKLMLVMLTIIHFALGCGAPEFEVFGAEGVAFSEEVLPGPGGVLQTNGRRMLVVARYNGGEPVNVQLALGGPLDVRAAQEDDGTALPEALALPLDTAVAGKGEARMVIGVEQGSPLIAAPGSAWRVVATWRDEEGALLHEAQHAVWIGDDPAARL